MMLEEEDSKKLFKKWSILDYVLSLCVCKPNW